MFSRLDHNNCCNVHSRTLKIDVLNRFVNFLRKGLKIRDNITFY